MLSYLIGNPTPQFMKQNSVECANSTSVASDDSSLLTKVYLKRSDVHGLTPS